MTFEEDQLAEAERALRRRARRFTGQAAMAWGGGGLVLLWLGARGVPGPVALFAAGLLAAVGVLATRGLSRRQRPRWVRAVADQYEVCPVRLENHSRGGPARG